MTLESNGNKSVEGKPFESKFPVVGIAASAGGLAAFTQLLSHLAVDTEMAFVLIQHLEPDRQSLLSELLAKATKMQVCEAQNGMVVEPNRVYTIPPNTKMVLLDGVLQLSPREKVFGKYMPGDALFTSLAVDRGDRAIAVVLSGGDGDGSLGLTAIKEAGGVTFAQCEATAKVDSMPTTAIATGNVDFVLPPEKIAQELLNLSRNPMFVCPQRLVASDGSSLFHQGSADEQQVALAKIFSLLLSITGVDFSYYKSKTLNRRIQRRMLLCRVEQLADYAVYLQVHPAEINALFEEIFIHVTSFFRDPAAFELLLTKVFPTITQHKSASPIRIWVAGCSTGEEVYSIAMCLLEFLADRITLPSIQILATDISESSLDRARAGIYNDNQMVDVSPERRHRFFKRHIASRSSNVGASYQIDRAVRELCVFTRQDLGSDAAGANFDLISCRNVLIYFDESLQQEMMPIFHDRLNSTGFLFLGTSESLGKSSDLFAQVEPQHQIYAKNSTATQSTFSGIPSSDALQEPLRKRTVGARSNLNNLANRQLSLEVLPEFDLPEKLERLQVANDKILWIEQELQYKYQELKTAKEEIEATTEELRTIEDELRYRKTQLDRVNQNSSVGVACRNENRGRDDFLSNLSHELRNPLTAIIGWAQLLQTHKLDKATVTHGLEVIYRNAKLQSQSIDNMLDLAQIASSKLHLNPIRLDLFSVLSAAIASVQHSADTKSIQLIVNLTPTTIMGDVDRLEQVLWNLLTNAIKFTPRGGKVEVTLTTVQNYAQIRVSDTGIGIGAKLLPYIFDRFQGDASSSKTSSGLRVGLSLVRQIVELHGGNVRAESAGERRGTTIVMQLPLEAVPSDAAATGRSVTEEVSLLEGLHILAVDDQPHILDLVKYILEDAGAAVTTVTSTLDALSSLVTSGVKYDALLADIGMPDEDGLALIRRIRALDPQVGGQIPAAAITAYGSERERQQAIAAGFQVHLAKPFYAEQLIQTVANLTERVKVT